MSPATVCSPPEPPPPDSGHVNAAASARAMRWLMGEQCQTLPADRVLARRLQAALPWLARSLEMQRGFLFHSTELFNQRLGIDQFITFSAGPYRPWPGLAVDLQPPCAAVPRAAFVHVNVLAATGESGRHCGHRHTCAGLAEMLRLLRHPALNDLDRRRPVGVLVDDIGPLTDSTADLQFGLDRLREWLPPGSAIALTHSTTDLVPAGRQPAVRAYDRLARLSTQATGRPYQPRRRAEIENLLAPWTLAGEGAVPTGAFFPDHAHAQLPEHHSGAYAAMALHPLHPDYAKHPDYNPSSPGSPTDWAAHPAPAQEARGEQAGTS
ncbi:SAM-dependent methyltransferase [Streptomyces microflavus]|uniref:SAM-dependent methyltransferase n=1 Tax=Streptomyces microflavus TaxID=1919 RepID=UPI0037F57432